MPLTGSEFTVTIWLNNIIHNFSRHISYVLIHLVHVSPYFIGFTTWISNIENCITDQASEIRALWQTTSTSSSVRVWPPSPWRISPSSLWYLLLPAPRKGQALINASLSHQPSNDLLLDQFYVRSQSCKCVLSFTCYFILYMSLLVLSFLHQLLP